MEIITRENELPDGLYSEEHYIKISSCEMCVFGFEMEGNMNFFCSIWSVQKSNLWYPVQIERELGASERPKRCPLNTGKVEVVKNE